MTLQTHIDGLKSSLDRLFVTPLVVENDLRVDLRAGDQAYVAGIIVFNNGSALHFTEFLDASESELEKISYRYHYQDRDNELIFRYDNAAHKPALPFQEHLHIEGRIVEAAAPPLQSVIREILISLESQQ